MGGQCFSNPETAYLHQCFINAMASCLEVPGATMFDHFFLQFRCFFTPPTKTIPPPITIQNKRLKQTLIIWWMVPFNAISSFFVFRMFLPHLACRAAPALLLSTQTPSISATYWSWTISNNAPFLTFTWWWPLAWATSMAVWPLTFTASNSRPGRSSSTDTTWQW